MTKKEGYAPRLAPSKINALLTIIQNYCTFVYMNEILLYKTDNAEVKVEILLQNENLWLTQAKMADLLMCKKPPFPNT